MEGMSSLKEQDQTLSVKNIYRHKTLPGNSVPTSPQPPSRAVESQVTEELGSGSLSHCSPKNDLTRGEKRTWGGQERGRLVSGTLDIGSLEFIHTLALGSEKVRLRRPISTEQPHNPEIP